MHKLKFLIQQGIIEYGDIDNFLSNMRAAYYVGDTTNKYLNAGRILCQGRRRFIVKLMEEQQHYNKIMFYEMLRKLMWIDVSAADNI